MAILRQFIAATTSLLLAFIFSFFTAVPDVFIDTTGFSFTLILAKILGVQKIVAYVHYPAMTHEILILPGIWKKIYYHIFLILYKISGWSCDLIFTNSNWTDKRLQTVWGRSSTVLYPPVALSNPDPTPRPIRQTPRPIRQNAIVSLAQFRPEKNHALQLLVFSKIQKIHPDFQFWVMGGARDDADLGRVEILLKIASELEIENLHFFINASREEIKTRLAMAKCAIHTMQDEHFGISIIEFMAAGLPVVAHRSGGPESDIILDKFGLLAESAEEFAEKVENVVSNFETDEIQSVLRDATDSLERFLDDEAFGERFARLSI